MEVTLCHWKCERMVRPRKIPRYYVPVEWTDTETDTNSDPDVTVEIPEILPENESVDSESEDEPEPDDYFPDILEDLAKEWLIVEMTHDVSKTASDQYWELAKSMFNKLPPKNSGKIPTYTHIRRKLVGKNCPEIKLEVTYKQKETGETVTAEVTSLPVTQYRKPAFEPLYEIASVNVSNINSKVF